MQRLGTAGYSDHITNGPLRKSCLQGCHTCFFFLENAFAAVKQRIVTTVKKLSVSKTQQACFFILEQESHAVMYQRAELQDKAKWSHPTLQSSHSQLISCVRQRDLSELFSSIFLSCILFSTFQWGVCATAASGGQSTTLWSCSLLPLVHGSLGVELMSLGLYGKYLHFLS